MRKFNEWVAVKATDIFGTMYTTYALFLYGFLPLLFPGLMVTLLYWSNTVQLWSLPLLMVGTAVTGRSVTRQAKETHDMVKKELALMKEMLECQKEHDEGH